EARPGIVLVGPPVGTGAAYHQETIAQRRDALDGALALLEHRRRLAAGTDTDDLAARRTREADHEQAVAPPGGSAYIRVVAEYAGERALAFAQVHLGRTAVAFVGKQGDGL